MYNCLDFPECCIQNHLKNCEQEELSKTKYEDVLIISAEGRLRQEDHKFKPYLGYIVRSYFRQQDRKEGMWGTSKGGKGKEGESLRFT